MSERDTSAENVARIIDNVTTNCSQPSEYGLLLPGPLVEAIELIEALAAERDALRLALSNLLTVMPVFPAPARQIIGMEERYNQAIKSAKEVIGL